MHKVCALILLLSVFYSCKHSHQTVQLPNEHSKDQAKKNSDQPTLDFGQPVQIDTSAYVMFPLGIKHDDNSLKSRGGSYEWNIVFLNTRTQQYHLLDSTKKMLIREYNIDQSSNDYVENNNHKADDKYLYYSVTTKDANNNGQLDDDDPTYLFKSDRDGNNFKQISPDNYYVFSWKVIKETQRVLISAVSPENMKKDNAKREITPFIYDLKTSTLSGPAFSEKFIQTTKKLFNKDWPDE